jgi:hypothetical protein
MYNKQSRHYLIMPFASVAKLQSSVAARVKNILVMPTRRQSNMFSPPRPEQ